MHFRMDRREFLGGIGAALGLAQVMPAATQRRLKIGHTGITWGFKPEDAAQAIHDVGSLGLFRLRIVR